MNVFDNFFCQTYGLVASKKSLIELFLGKHTDNMFDRKYWKLLFLVQSDQVLNCLPF